jgi:hypothetical protein
MDTVGKVFVVAEKFRRCLVCDELFTVEITQEHATSPCFPKPEARCLLRRSEPKS